MHHPNFKTYLILVLISFSFQLNSQTHFGLRGGPNVANVSTTKDGTISSDLITGINAGVNFDFNLNEKWSIQPELNFLQKGYKRKFEVAFGKTYLIKLNYVDLSVLMKYKIKKKSKRTTPKPSGYILVGPYIGRAISGTSKDLFDGEKDSIELTGYSRYIRADLGVSFGGGLVVPAGIGNLIFDVRSNLGIIKFNDAETDSGNIRHQGLVFSIGYVFNLGK